MGPAQIAALAQRRLHLKVVLASGIVLSAFALQACALLFPPFPILRLSGVNVSDKFDNQVANAAMGCHSQHWQKMLRDAGRKPDRCGIVADAFSRVILGESKPGASARDYLRSKGGRCTELTRGIWRCIVEREVTMAGYIGDQPTGPPRRTLVTLTVEIHEHDGKIQTDVDRYDFALNEKRAAGP